MSDDRQKRVAKSTAVTTIFGNVGALISFLTVPFLLRWLGGEKYGLMLTVLAFNGYIGFADVGLNWGSVVLISEAFGKSDRAGIARIFRHSLVLAGGSALLAVGVAAMVAVLARHGHRLPMFDQQPSADLLVLVAALQCAANMVLGSFYNVFQGMQEAYWAGFYQGLARLVAPVGVLLAAYITRDPAVALAANGVVVVIFGCFAIVHLFRKHPWLFAYGSVSDKAQYRRQIRTGMKSFGLQIARTIQGTTPVMVISSVCGPTLVPVYTVATTVLAVVFGVFSTWNVNMQPAYGAAWAANEQGWVADSFKRTLQSIVLIGLAAIAGFVAVGPEAIKLWTQGSLRLSSSLCLSVALVSLIQAVAASVQYCLAGINQHRRIAMIELLHTGVMVVSCTVLVRIFGPVGIGWGAILAYAGTALWLGFGNLARTLRCSEVIPRFGWIWRVGISALLGIGFGILWFYYVPANERAVLDIVLAGLGAILAAGFMVGLTVMLEVRSLDEWLSVLQGLMRVPLNLARSIVGQRE